MFYTYTKKKSFSFPWRISGGKLIPTEEHAHKKKNPNLCLMTSWIHTKWDNIYVSKIPMK